MKVILVVALCLAAAEAATCPSLSVVQDFDVAKVRTFTGCYLLVFAHILIASCCVGWNIDSPVVCVAYVHSQTKQDEGKTII